MNAPVAVETFSLPGGPLRRLGRRLGLVRGESNTFPLGVAIALFLWVVLVLLTVAEGLGQKVFSMTGVGVHVRLLVAIPLFFACETLFNPCARTFVRQLVESEVVPERSRPALEDAVARSNRLANAWVPELVALLFSIALVVAGSWLPALGFTEFAETNRGDLTSTLAGFWYWDVCLTVLRFLMLRWAWQWFVWCLFLWRLSRIDMHLEAIHPDGQAGLGYLQVVHAQFFPLVMALSAIQSAAIVEDVVSGRQQPETVYPSFVVVLLLQALLFLGPLLIMAPRLRRARLEGLDSYMEMASHYVNAFGRKWRPVPGQPPKPMLGTADLQSLADLQNSLRVVDELIWIPVSLRLALFTAAASVVPALPLLLLKYPIAELGQKLMERLLPF